MGDCRGMTTARSFPDTRAKAGEGQPSAGRRMSTKATPLVGYGAAGVFSAATWIVVFMVVSRFTG